MIRRPRRWRPLFVAGLLAAGCSSQELPPATGTGGPGGNSSGAGGAGTGGFGAGGAGGNAGAGGPGGFGGAGPGGVGGGPGICSSQSAGCVSSCTTAPFVYVSPVCAGGNWICPDGSVSLSTCDPSSCAQLYQDCCDDISGAVSAAPCSGDGQVAACPDGTHNSRRYCVPAILGTISNCNDLAYQPCAVEGQRCYSSAAANCTCRTTPGSDAGLAWDCPPFIP